MSWIVFACTTNECDLCLKQIQKNRGASLDYPIQQHIKRKNMKTLKVLAILGFGAAVIGNLVSLFRPIQTMPTWDISIFICMFPLGIATFIGCMKMGFKTGIWGRRKQWEYITSRCPKWAPKVAMGLFVYFLSLFALMAIRNGGSKLSTQNASQLFTSGAMNFYFFIAMFFHASDEVINSNKGTPTGT